MGARPLPVRERARGTGEGDAGPRLLITGFGPFPGAPENPTEDLVRTLADEPAASFGASALKALVMRTDYKRSWPTLRRVYRNFDPHVVVHFGLNGKAKAIHIETIGINRIDATKPDASGSAPRTGRVRRAGPEKLQATLESESILAALEGIRIPAQLSENAGAYVCNATLYRSLHAAPVGRKVGFIHVPPDLAPTTLLAASRAILSAACAQFDEPT
jgi:pyroglutamyl-peptidase